jgi:leucyl/phenylalanyl-tRNA--protein transferase
MSVFLLSQKIEFPSPHFAEEDGLLAVGGCLSEERLLLAYRMGIFPWFSEGDPVLWWSPDPRLALYPQELRVSKSLQKVIRKKQFHLTMDTAFTRVINACASSRTQNNEGTWLTEYMIESYIKLHESGFAHSVEAWYKGELAGGLYGVSLGRCFFGESMFTRLSNASKVAFVALVHFLEKMSFDLIDCQITTRHMVRFGAKEVPRAMFLKQVEDSLQSSTKKGKWSFD